MYKDKQESKLTFRDRGSQFAVLIDSIQMDNLLKQCANAGEYETGGILIGYYSEKLNTAIVTRVVDAPDDSRRGRNWFHRGISGLQVLILGLWARQRHYYLGEWHYHPKGSPEASAVDVRQMEEIASSSSYQCPEPILLIIGGNPERIWSMQITIFKKSSGSLILDNVTSITP